MENSRFQLELELEKFNQSPVKDPSERPEIRERRMQRVLKVLREKSPDTVSMI
jgi:hypothetical protein